MADNRGQSAQHRLKRLAQSIDALSEKDEILMRYTRDMTALRRAAAAELHSICAGFVSAVNLLLSQGTVTLDPPEFSTAIFRDYAPNLIQINVRGRILQVGYTVTEDLSSTEDFRIPYTLEGFVRAFNQKLLDKNLIEEQLIFYTLEKSGNLWRFFDARTYRSGAFDQDYLVTLMEQII
ncbi:MAG: hypothetical protein P4L56_29250 [Candidatus Sulfopaludibacter sp.]|nr:hypothetical protein [Candidatus Sulfopaludibacter sp.]